MTRDNQQTRWTQGPVVAAHWSPLIMLGALATLATESLWSRPAPPPHLPLVVVERCVPAARTGSAPAPAPAVAPARAVAPASATAPAPAPAPAVATSREYLRRGARYAAREQWEKALVAYTWARDTAPRSAAAHLGRALVLLELGRVDAAARAAARAQALSREPGEALVIQGLVAQLKGHRDVAYGRYRAYLAASPDGPWADELRHVVGPAEADQPEAPRP